MELNFKSRLFKIIVPHLLTLNSFAIGVPELDGAINIKSSQKISTEKKKKFQLYYFWATWCPDCKEKLKTDLSKYETEISNFSTFSIEKEKDKIKEFALKTSTPYDVYFDENRSLQKSFKIFSVPTIVLAQVEKSEIKVLKQVSGKDWTEIDYELKKLGTKEP